MCLCKVCYVCVCVFEGISGGRIGESVFVVDDGDLRFTHLHEGRKRKVKENVVFFKEEIMIDEFGTSFLFVLLQLSISYDFQRVKSISVQERGVCVCVFSSRV